MTRLERYADDSPDKAEHVTGDAAEIRDALAVIGVRYERRRLRDLPPDTGQDAILAAYAADVETLKAEGGYRAVDVVRMTPDHADRASIRARFLDEHRHAEDEVRFFVEGEGLFTLHAQGKVYCLLCGAGDLISVPAGMAHWFDMGPSPCFTAIRLFTNPDGWVAAFTGDDIARRFPRHEPALT